MTKTSQKIRTLCALAFFVALAYVVMLVFRIKIQFLTLEFKDAIIAISALHFGPLAGVAVSVAVALLEMPTSDTQLYGFLMNALAAIAFSVPASLIYRKKRNLTFAAIGLGCSIVVMTATMCLANILITPHFMGAPVGVVIDMLPTLLFPFNLIKSVANTALVFLLYKPMTTALKHAKLIEKSPRTSEPPESGVKKRMWITILVNILAALLLVAALLVIFLVLKGDFSFIS